MRTGVGPTSFLGRTPPRNREPSGSRKLCSGGSPRHTGEARRVTPSSDVSGREEAIANLGRAVAAGVVAGARPGSAGDRPKAQASNLTLVRSGRLVCWHLEHAPEIEAGQLQ